MTDICIIYLYQNKIDGKIYVGQTWEGLEKRWNGGYGYKNSVHFYNAIQKYGKDAFESKILTVVNSQEMADYWENFFQEKYDSRNPEKGYNIKIGGVHGKHSEETKLKISNAVKGDKHPLYGTHLSQDTKNKISETQKTNGLNKGEKNAFYGKKHSEETRVKMSEAKKGKKLSPDHKNNIIKSLKGRKHSEETKQKMSKTHKDRWSNKVKDE